MTSRDLRRWRALTSLALFPIFTIDLIPFSILQALHAPNWALIATFGLVPATWIVVGFVLFKRIDEEAWRRSPRL